MAEHRRVEPRAILGTGMATDPERLREIEDEASRRERASREKGELGFGDVLKTAPARGTLDGDDEPAPSDTSDADGTAAADGKPDAPGKPSVKAASAVRPQGPRAPPDPRAALLHRQLDAGKAAGKKGRP